MVELSKASQLVSTFVIAERMLLKKPGGVMGFKHGKRTIYIIIVGNKKWVTHCLLPHGRKDAGYILSLGPLFSLYAVRFRKYIFSFFLTNSDLLIKNFCTNL